MKAFRLLTMAMLCMAITMVSCSDGEDGKDGLPGEDGAQGAQGVAGADGADGADGTSCWDLNGNGTGDAAEDINDDGNFDALDCQGADGANGLDGNANVLRGDINIQADFSGSSMIVDVPQFIGIDLADLPNYALYYYLTTSGNPNTIVFPVPGPLNSNVFYSRVFTSYDTGNVAVNFYDTATDNAYNVAPGTFGLFTIIAIEAPAPGNKSAAESVAAQLKAAGVDTNDYYAMVEYLGLK